MRAMTALMVSLSLVTTALFAHALATVDHQPAPQVVRVTSR